MVLKEEMFPEAVLNDALDVEDEAEWRTSSNRFVKPCHTAGVGQLSEGSPVVSFRIQ